MIFEFTARAAWLPGGYRNKGRVSHEARLLRCIKSAFSHRYYIKYGD